MLYGNRAMRQKDGQGAIEVQAFPLPGRERALILCLAP